MKLKPSTRKCCCHEFLVALAITAMFSTGRANAANCSVEQSVPSNQSQIGAGSATAGSDGVTMVTGDQAVYVQIKNVNVLGAAYTVTIARNTTPVDVICTYTAILLPQTSVIVSGAVFASPPVGWKITVSVGDESDAAVLTYTVFSLSQSVTSNSAVNSLVKTMGVESRPQPGLTQNADTRNPPSKGPASQLRRNQTNGACTVQPANTMHQLGILLASHISRKDACQDAKTRKTDDVSQTDKCPTYTNGTIAACHKEGIELTP